MRLVFGLVLVVGLALAGFAVMIAKDRFDQYQSALQRTNDALLETTEVYVAARALRYGEPVTEDDVELIRWPVEYLPEGAFGAKEEMFPPNTDELRIVLRAMEKSEPILAIKVTEPGEDAGVASRLAAGMRAFAIRVDVTSGVSGFLRPGDRVDVYWTGSGALENEGEITRLIESGVKLVAIDQTADNERTNPTVARTVTVEATPEQVARLAQAQSTGRLSLALMGAQETGLSEAVEVDQNKLLGVTREAAPVIRDERICTVRTRRGAEVVEIPIPCTD